VIIEVVLRIAADDGMPFVLAEERRMVVQAAGDFEGNVLKGGASLEDAVARTLADAKQQIRRYREADARSS
jgi:hypothetical protein